MPNKSLLMLCLLALIPLSTVAQKANFTDASAPSSPLQLSGEIVSASRDTESTYYVNGKKMPTVDFVIRAKNVSSKEILAYSLGAPSLGFSHGTYDHYFKAGGWPEDDMTETVPGIPSSVRALSNPEAKVFFVQFVDGSAWGDASIGAEIRARRLAEMQFNDEALRIYQSQGESAFLALLNAEHESLEAARALHIQKTSGTAAAIDSISSRQKFAKERQASGIY